MSPGVAQDRSHVGGIAHEVALCEARHCRLRDLLFWSRFLCSVLAKEASPNGRVDWEALLASRQNGRLVRHYRGSAGYGRIRGVCLSRPPVCRRGVPCLASIQQLHWLRRVLASQPDWSWGKKKRKTAGAGLLQCRRMLLQEEALS